jgi:hypothetical protein
MPSANFHFCHNFIGIVFTEVFLLRAMEGLSSNHYLQVITDRTHINPKLQVLLAGDRNQPLTNTRLRSVWNDLTVDDCQHISDSFMDHVRFAEKRAFSRNLKTIKSFFGICRIPPRRRSKPEDLPFAKEFSLLQNIPPYSSSHLPASLLAGEEHIQNFYQRYIDETTDSNTNTSTMTSTYSQPFEAMEQLEGREIPFFALTDTTNLTVKADEPPKRRNDDVSSATPTPPLDQQDEAILILLDIADTTSVNSSSTKGYTTSMTSSIGSSSNMSRTYRQYNSNNNYRPNSSHQHFPVHDPNDGHINHATSSIDTERSKSPSTNNYPRTDCHRKQQGHDTDNESTTSSNTGYISTASNGHFSISGSVASV